MPCWKAILAVALLCSVLYLGAKHFAKSREGFEEEKDASATVDKTFDNIQLVRDQMKQLAKDGKVPIDDVTARYEEIVKKFPEGRELTGDNVRDFLQGGKVPDRTDRPAAPVGGDAKDVDPGSVKFVKQMEDELESIADRLDETLDKMQQWRLQKFAGMKRAEAERRPASTSAPETASAPATATATAPASPPAPATATAPAPAPAPAAPPPPASTAAEQVQEEAASGIEPFMPYMPYI